MEWRGRRESTNIEDRRGTGSGPGGGFGGPRMSMGGRGGGGLGIGAIAVILIVGWIAGINPIDLLSQMEGGSPISTSTSGSQTSGKMGTPSDDEGQFVATVLADTETTWHDIFQRAGERYEEPTLVIFDGGTQSACGYAQTAMGPFYCPNDHKVYIDLAFYRELADRFGAPGDFAEAYVIAHEIGHHVQNLIGTLGKVDAERRRASEADSNALSVRIELQADCYAGIWAHDEEQRGFLEVGDIDEALTAAAAVGDDRLQKESQGYVVPDSFTHGTSEQRSRWFKRGYNGGSLDSCDTFSAQNL
jgi:predicted metalloprotease